MTLVQFRVAHHNGVFYRELVIGKVILLQNGHSLTRSDDNLARIMLQLTRKHLQKGGFSRSIGTDNTVAVTGGEFEIYVFKKWSVSKLETYVAYCYHISLFLIKLLVIGLI